MTKKMILFTKYCLIVKSNIYFFHTLSIFIMKMIKEKHISCKFKANAEMQDLRRLWLQESKYEVVTDGIQLTGLMPPHV